MSMDGTVMALGRSAGNLAASGGRTGGNRRAADQGDACARHKLG